MTNYEHGHRAELIAADHLRVIGWIILDINWRTVWCEIDIVASMDNTVCFFEVKYRINDRQGTGIEYITQKKLSQMSRAAESWIQKHTVYDDYTLGVIEVSGKDYTITNVLIDVD